MDVTVLLYWEFSFCELAGASNLIAASVPYFIIGSSDVLFIRSNVVFPATIVALSLLSALCVPESFGTQLSISYTDLILLLKARNMSARPTITVTNSTVWRRTRFRRLRGTGAKFDSMGTRCTYGSTLQQSHNDDYDFLQYPVLLFI